MTRHAPLSALAAACALCLAGCALLFTSDTTGAQARALVNGGARLLDVRTKGEFDAGHLDGAVNIPVGELEGRLAELPPPATPIVVYCLSGHRAARAAELLRAHGFTEVHNLGPKHYW